MRFLYRASSGAKKKPLCIFKDKGNSRNTHGDKKVKNRRNIDIAYTDKFLIPLIIPTTIIRVDTVLRTTNST